MMSDSHGVEEAQNLSGCEPLYGEAVEIIVIRPNGNFKVQRQGQNFDVVRVPPGDHFFRRGPSGAVFIGG